MRNRLVHGYFDIDLDLVWEAAARDVPGYAASVRVVLDELLRDEPSGERES